MQKFTQLAKDGPVLSAIAVVAAALVVKAGVAVLRARLDDLDAVDHQLVEHVVGEAGRRLPGVQFNIDI